jgi:hypothetical protein
MESVRAAVLTIKESLFASKTELTKLTDEIIEKVKEHSSEIQKEIQEMIGICERIIENERGEKLETVIGLSVSQAAQACPNWTIPKLEVDLHFFSRIPKIFSIPPLHFTPLHFSMPAQPYSYIGYFADTKELTVFDTRTEEEFNISNEIFHYTSGLLYLGGDQFLATAGVAAGKKQTFLVKCSSKEVTRLPDLEEERIHFCMGWVDGLPAVIGGSTGLRPLSTVEVLENTWKPHSSLNIARSEATCLTVNAESFVFGGMNYQRVDSIEVYRNHQWQVLSVKMPIRANLVGVIKVNTEEVLVLGGAEGNDKLSNTVWKTNLHTGMVSACSPMSVNCFFPKQMISVQDLKATCVVKDRMFKRVEKINLTDFI